VSDRLLEIHDGPILDLGLKGIAGRVIQLPRRRQDRPDRKALGITLKGAPVAAEAASREMPVRRF
jgi:hypothetical protein